MKEYEKMDQRMKGQKEERAQERSDDEDKRKQGRRKQG